LFGLVGAIAGSVAAVYGHPQAQSALNYLQYVLDKLHELWEILLFGFLGGILGLGFGWALGLYVVPFLFKIAKALLKRRR